MLPNLTTLSVTAVNSETTIDTKRIRLEGVEQVKDAVVRLVLSQFDDDPDELLIYETVHTFLKGTEFERYVDQHGAAAVSAAARSIASYENFIATKTMWKTIQQTFPQHTALLAEIPKSRRPADRAWWREWERPNRDAPFAAPSLTADADGYVVVDLWHAMRGESKKTFRNFEPKIPTFFAESFHAMLDLQAEGDLDDYLEESEELEKAPQPIYVKRGRFKFRPLLWHNHVALNDLKNDKERFDTIKRIMERRLPGTDVEAFDDGQWRRALKQNRSYKLYGKTMNRGLRLDNNCVDPEIPLANEFGGTLSVDLSGFAGAILPPWDSKIGAIQSDSVVVWNPAAHVQEESEWMLLNEWHTWI